MKNIPHLVGRAAKVMTTRRGEELLPVCTVYTEHQNLGCTELKLNIFEYMNHKVAIRWRSSPWTRAGVIKSKWWWSVELMIVGRKKWGSKLKFHSGDPNSQVLWSQSHLSLWGEKLETLHNRTHECELNWLPIIIRLRRSYMKICMSDFSWKLESGKLLSELRPGTPVRPFRLACPPQRPLPCSPSLIFLTLPFPPEHLTLQPLVSTSSRFPNQWGFRKQADPALHSFHVFLQWISVSFTRKINKKKRSKLKFNNKCTL